MIRLIAPISESVKSTLTDTVKLWSTDVSGQSGLILRLSSRIIMDDPQMRLSIDGFYTGIIATDAEAFSLTNNQSILISNAGVGISLDNSTINFAVKARSAEDQNLPPSVRQNLEIVPAIISINKFVRTGMSLNNGADLLDTNLAGAKAESTTCQATDPTKAKYCIYYPYLKPNLIISGRGTVGGLIAAQADSYVVLQHSNFNFCGSALPGNVGFMATNASNMTLQWDVSPFNTACFELPPSPKPPIYGQTYGSSFPAAASCPIGYTQSGANCVGLDSTTIPPVYSCPGGYSLFGYGCYGQFGYITHETSTGIRTYLGSPIGSDDSRMDTLKK